jgi:hypothetical protein
MSSPQKGRADYFAKGDWNIACSICGRKLKASKAERNWQGLYRHPECNEPRQPQDYARGVKDIMDVPFAQPETDTYISYCAPPGNTAFANYAIPDCSVPDVIPLPWMISPYAPSL